jgi:meso-butanediol dehydrogenase/(S,S)-butanediol dehydrogenase/diacetyl reductase
VRLDGKVALITGGGSGIGAAIAERFVAEGARVCITGRRRDTLAEVAGSLPDGTAVICVGDASRQEDVERMVAETIAFGGGLDILVNNAGLSTYGSVADADRAEWQEIIDVNLSGPFMLMQQAIPHMIERGGGAIVNVASLGGMRALPEMAAYCSSKAGLIMLTQQAALDYGRHNIRCNAVCPGAVRTPMIEQELSEACETLGCDTTTYLSRLTEALPLKRWGEPHEIAATCAFLASDDASFITGAALLVDGGTAIVDVYGAAFEASLKPTRKDSA